MRSLPATLVAFLLLLMLAVTTPTGTGSGVHASMLLHPLFSHTHFIDGRIVTHEQLAAAASVQMSTDTRGPAFGAGAGASALADGLAISPVVPWQEVLLLGPFSQTYPAIEYRLPTGATRQPPHPPPTLHA